MDSCGLLRIHMDTLTSMPRSEVRVTMSRELYREVSKAAKSENRTLADWIRLACNMTLTRRSAVIDALNTAKREREAQS